MTCRRCKAPERDYRGETARFYLCGSYESVDGIFQQSPECLSKALAPVTSRVAYDSNDRVTLLKLVADMEALQTQVADLKERLDDPSKAWQTPPAV